MDALRTMWFALSTLDAVVRLTLTRHDALQRDEILAAVLAILFIADTPRQ